MFIIYLMSQAAAAAHIMYHQMAGRSVNDEFEKMWKEAVVAQHLSGGAVEKCVILTHGNQSTGKDLNLGAPEYEAKYCPLDNNG
jgi:hypothetical protein